MLLEPRNQGILRFPLGVDHAQRIPHGDGAVAEATGEEAEGEGVAVSGAGAGPGEAVEAVGGRGGGEEGEVGRVGLEVEAEDLDVGRRGEEHVDGAAHGAGGEVGRLRRQRRQRRPLRALDARHLRRRDPADLGTRAPSPLAATRNLFLGDLETGEREREGRKEIEGDRRRSKREGREEGSPDRSVVVEIGRAHV